MQAWLDRPFLLESRGRALRPEDILILVRRRGELAALIVARLHAEGVPVAGVDRLLLTAPLAVQDLLAAARFAAQPLDDLNLAAPARLAAVRLERRTQLFEAALRPRGRALAASPGDRAAAMAGLQSILAMADYATPHLFLETILSGPLDGRRKLLERLGPRGARSDRGIALLRARVREQLPPPSLQRFLDWFARGDVEIVRDPSAPLDAVRVMTVHGAKGLQSPVVILADACADPDRTGRLRRQLREAAARRGRAAVPVFRPRKDELAEPLRSQIERAGPARARGALAAALRRA